jgi:A/G-specific adenine glycosylase
MKEFPTIEDLAKASPERVNEMWAGLGYYRRAKFLQQCAKAVVEKHNGVIPKTAKELETLPGIGKYTAGAIASIAFGEVTPIVGMYKKYIGIIAIELIKSVQTEMSFVF